MLTLVIAAYVLYHVATSLPRAASVLMEGSPDGLDLDKLVADVSALDGVEDMYHIHVWELYEGHRVLEARECVPRTPRCVGHPGAPAADTTTATRLAEMPQDRIPARNVRARHSPICRSFRLSGSRQAKEQIDDRGDRL